VFRTQSRERMRQVQALPLAVDTIEEKDRGMAGTSDLVSYITSDL
jgi:hypothetical protein